MSITKYASATTRMVLDSIRTVVIWAYGLIFGGEQFQYLQVIGFVLLLAGTFIYNEVLVIPWGPMRPLPKPVAVSVNNDTNHEEKSPLLNVSQSNGTNVSSSSL